MFSYHLLLVHPSGRVLRRFPTEIPNTLLVSPIVATNLAHRELFDSSTK